MPPPSDASTATRWLAVSRRDPPPIRPSSTESDQPRYSAVQPVPAALPDDPTLSFSTTCTIPTVQEMSPCTLGWDKESLGRTLCNRARAIITAAVESGTPWTVDSVAQELNITGAHLHRQFKRHFDLTPRSFAASLSKVHMTSDGSTMSHQDCQSDLLDLAQDCPHIQDVHFPNLPFSLDFGDGLDDVYFTSPNIQSHSEKTCTELNPSETWNFDIQQLLSIEDVVYDVEDE
ncbi:uncharacterized protein NECHADRAFT_78334 [Fusarium vanettenii 77-13-4]|uniref:HTH araC/xylS-type domain-containing protein n=1 Tax=Fusarium vanettenii (strain ATCC MYA-4622 / CBS 123669 / FGSC 9596 / NRRL 45880 / 77-13-4) TaxID=660122 RepID=C7ZFI3_FUSV7|nr:uncharacterized protein NECHADRAFT_78334 [Fusarium vanettenii 77-13-4]EEU37156.1 predicted protein [Fusarium vanettenii 77-13-4]